MKKISLLTIGLLLLAVPVFAVIADTAHDLSSANTNGSGSNTNESCVFCHTPHGAGSAGSAPLWNRTAGDFAGVSDVYGDPTGTMDSVTTTTNADGSDAALCLSCHDGTIANSLTNPPNSLGATPLAVTATVTGAANIGLDLSNDHPIAISYATAGAGLETQGNAESAGIVFYTQDVTGDATEETDVVWCSSCHDVHDNSNPPFLIISNTQSNLCTACHIK